VTEDTLSGRKIGNYVVTRLLGKGGMGSVYLARHPEIGREVAIKVMDRLKTELEPRRFVDEATAATRIKHPNIVEVYDLGRTTEGWIYYVMEVLEGRDLGQIMEQALEQRGRMTPKEVLPYLEQICAGLQAAHDAGVVHRDLKPENVYVIDGDHLRLKLLDFGIAKLLEREDAGVSHTMTGALMGTPLIMAPEQAAGKHRQVSNRTDLYSLGVILFWMLAGRPPFEETEVLLLLADHLKEPPPVLKKIEPTVPPAVSDLVMRCLEKDPDLRPASARDLLDLFCYAMEQATSPDAGDVDPYAHTSGPDEVAGGGEAEVDAFAATTGPQALLGSDAQVDPYGLTTGPVAPAVLDTAGEVDAFGPTTGPPDAVSGPITPSKRVGQVLKDTYRIERLVGKGGMGAVFEASHRRLPRRFAIKLLFPETIASPSALELFHREAEVTSRLGHDNIVEVVDFDQTPDGAPFIVMEMLEGEDLADRIARQGRLDLEQTLSVMTQVASAVGAAHAEGVVHRDLKPKNIFLCPRKGREDLVKVLDFGISKIMGARTAVAQQQTMLGSLYYMPPEQTQSTDVDHRADVYAAGTIAYSMLTGRPPFLGEDLHRVYQQVLKEAPPPLRSLVPGVPEVVEKEVLRALSKRPEDRHGSMAELSRSLERAVMRAMSESFERGEPVRDGGGLETLDQEGAGGFMEGEESPGVGTPFPDLPTQLKASPVNGDLRDSLPPADSGLSGLEDSAPADALDQPTSLVPRPGSPAAPADTVHVGAAHKPRVLWPVLLGAFVALVLVAGAALWQGGHGEDTSAPRPAVKRALSSSHVAVRSLEKKPVTPPEKKPVTPPEKKPVTSPAVPPGPRAAAKRTQSKPPRARPTRPPRKATLVVTTLSEGEMAWANVWVDGKKVGQTPLERKYPPGRHLVRVHRKGYRPVTRKVDLKPGRREGLVLELTADEGNK